MKFLDFTSMFPQNAESSSSASSFQLLGWFFPSCFFRLKTGLLQSLDRKLFTGNWFLGWGWVESQKMISGMVFSFPVGFSGGFF